MVDYPALSGIDDPAQARVALVVNKQIAHVPLLGMGLQPLDAMLTALAALITVTDRGLYFTGADAPALFTLTAAGRALMDDADAAAMRTTLGVNAAKATFASVTLSGTSVDFTGIPAGVTRITVNLAGASMTSTTAPYFQLGDSGGVETSGYLSDLVVLSNAAAVACSNNTVAFQIGNGVAAQTYHGSIVFNLVNASTNTWEATGNFAFSNGAAHTFTAGTKPLSATLDRVRITSSSGADTFDAGTANISWEF